MKESSSVQVLIFQEPVLEDEALPPLLPPVLEVEEDVTAL